MSVSMRASRRLRRPSTQRLGVAAAIVVAGGAALSLHAPAEPSDANASSAPDERAPTSPEARERAERDVTVRRIIVTPADREDLVVDPEPVDALTTALAARYELVATAPPEPEPEPALEPSTSSDGDTGSSTSADGSAVSGDIATTQVPLATWEAVARCESGYGGEPDWSIDTGNGYYGGLQFSLSSWEWVGGTGYPHEASKATQIEMAERLWERQGWNAWPACSSKLGLR